ncbi:MAG: glycosyltransferase family 4 protein [Elusimicrobia bacterium]|nr:glycosyltransferase family 4 protein [Elusimicrobiota bacterium]
MKIGLAWLDPADPTDAAVGLGVGRGLRGLGHEAVMVGPRRLAGQSAEESWEGFRLLRVGEPSARPADGRSADERAAAGLLGLQRRFGFDLWHCHVFGRPHRALARASRLGRWPMVASLHLVLEDYLPFAGGKRELGALLRRSRHVTAVSAWSLGEALRVWPDLAGRSSVVPCGLPDPAPGSRAGGPSPEAGRAGAPRGPYILCVARQAPYKGLDVLLMAFARFLEKRKGIKLVVVGRDQLAGALPRFCRTLGIEEQVVFTGALPPASVRRLIEGCLFFVLPSRRETLGMALLEAMACGKACVASRVGGVPELAADKKHALLVPPGDVEALARAMGLLASDPGERKRLGTSARERSRRFQWGGVAASYAAIYERVLR